MSSFHNNALVGASGQGGYQIERSLRFNSADSAYLSRAGWTGNQQLQTFSLWVKRTALGSRQTLFGGTNSSGLYGLYFEFDANDALLIGDYSTVWVWQLNTTARYRDPSAWYHIVFAVDTANATASNRAKLYINGVQVTAFSTASYMSQNYNMYWGYVSYVLAIGRLGENSSQYFNGYMTDVYFIDGQALTPSSFGETDTITGVWKPKKYAGTYGTNGFYLKFADNSGTTSTTLGKDSSGNGNNWTPNNFSVTPGAGNDSMIDTPTPYADGGNGRGNYCTWLPQQGGQTWTFSNGNLDAVNGNAGAAAFSCIGTIAVSTGKWYWEVTCNDAGPTTLRVPGVGIMGNERNVLSAAATVRPDVYLSGNGTIDNSAGTALQSGFSNMAAGDVVGVAVDADAKTVQFYRNGSAVGTAQAYTPAFVTPSFYSFNTYDCNANFGQRAFAYTPPSGFLALNTQNLPEPSIKKPSSYFDVKTWTATGTDPLVISGLGFSPDLVWAKARNDSYNHVLVDQVRGVNNVLSSNLTNAEASYTTVTQFNSDGFNAGGTTNNNYSLNCTATIPRTYVAWCWDESATPGFDIVTYTGDGVNTRTISHGLGVTPAFFITKNRDGYNNSQGFLDWSVYHQNLPSYNTTGSQALYLMSTTNAGSAGGFFTRPTSTVFTPNQTAYDNVSTRTYVAYLWSEVAGFSKFGSYTGNGVANGPFVHLGFRPRYLLVKRSDSANDWLVFDSARDQYNETDDLLYANLSNAEASNSATDFDFLSNGFKLRASNANQNASGGTYIFAAFAESPFKYSLAR